MSAEHICISPHKENYIWEEESQIIFYASYKKSLFDSDYVEIYCLNIFCDVRRKIGRLNTE